MTQRFMVVSDDDGHDYVIPAERESEWSAYLQAVYSDKYPDEPKWAQPIGGAISLLTFTDPVIK